MRVLLVPSLLLLGGLVNGSSAAAGLQDYVGTTSLPTLQEVQRSKVTTTLTGELALLVGLPDPKELRRITQLAARMAPGFRAARDVGTPIYELPELVRRAEGLATASLADQDGTTFLTEVSKNGYRLSVLQAAANRGDADSGRKWNALLARVKASGLMSQAMATAQYLTAIRGLLAQYATAPSTDDSARRQLMEAFVVLGSPTVKAARDGLENLLVSEAQANFQNLMSTLMRDIWKSDKPANASREWSCGFSWEPESASLGSRRPGDLTVGGMRHVETCNWN